VATVEQLISAVRSRHRQPVLDVTAADDTHPDALSARCFPDPFCSDLQQPSRQSLIRVTSLVECATASGRARPDFSLQAVASLIEFEHPAIDSNVS
jgi:hypothetical protein